MDSRRAASVDHQPAGVALALDAPPFGAAGTGGLPELLNDGPAPSRDEGPNCRWGSRIPHVDGRGDCRNARFPDGFGWKLGSSSASRGPRDRSGDPSRRKPASARTIHMGFSGGDHLGLQRPLAAGLLGPPKPRFPAAGCSTPCQPRGGGRCARGAMGSSDCLIPDWHRAFCGCASRLRPSVRPAKITGVHPTFPGFVRAAYFWLLASAVLSVVAAGWDRAGGLWGASRHALTVGFISTMVFAIGQRVLPAFCGMRVLFSPRLMFASLVLMNAGCAMRAVSETGAYECFLPSLWQLLPVSALIEMTAVTVFAANLMFTFRQPPAHIREQVSAASG